MAIRNESKRILLALIVLCGVGAATFAAVTSSATIRTYAKDALATRLKHGR